MALVVIGGAGPDTVAAMLSRKAGFLLRMLTPGSPASWRSRLRRPDSSDGALAGAAPSLFTLSLEPLRQRSENWPGPDNHGEPRALFCRSNYKYSSESAR